MDAYDCDYFMRRSQQVPAFGSWDCDGGGDFPIPFTQCFESARQAAGLLRYSYSEDRDLYVAGDLYENDVVTPTMIVVPRRRVVENGGKGGGKEAAAWVVGQCGYEDFGAVVKEPPSPPPPSPPPSKAVDEDLYKISPDLLCSRAKRRRSWGFFSSCLRPVCV
ncbi:unnamed protein product [Cuscuta campestris]|uniref:RIN4 pathogenic type III effector avirulence factor Avr cleavage site domain-containing protein n=1 Tax=Cuscuta campestris TaxID=132261 RepID=A0A484NLG0_9ASTE|nr:unnamed protein product [Cuscuta campestris]